MYLQGEQNGVPFHQNWVPVQKICQSDCWFNVWHWILTLLFCWVCSDCWFNVWHWILTLLFCWVCSDCWFMFGIKFRFRGMMSTVQIALVHQFGFFFLVGGEGYSNYCHVVDCMIAQFVDFILYKWVEEVIVNIISSKLKHPIISQSRIHSSCLVSSWERCKWLLESFRSRAGSGWNDASIQIAHGLRQTMGRIDVFWTHHPM